MGDHERLPDGAGVAAVVVAGGAGRRMGGVDKAALDVAGSTLLDRVLAAARPLCRDLVVVGPSRTTCVPGVRFLQEREPGSGPLPAVLAGAAATDAEVVLVLAADLPLVGTPDLRRLLEALADEPELDAAAALDERPAANPLLAAYRRPALERAAASELPPGTPASHLLAGAVVTVDLGALATLNINRPADLHQALAILDPR